MYCPNCGKEIPSDSVFCEECGCRIDAPAAGRAPAPSPGPKKSAKSGSGAGKYVLICLLAMVVIVAGVFVTIKALKTEKPEADTSAATEESAADVLEEQQMPDAQPEAERAKEETEPAKEESEPDSPADTSESGSAQPDADTDSGPDAAAQGDEETEPLPYEDSLEAPKDVDFAWIPDVVTGDLTGDFLGNDKLIGKWKGEIIYDKGIWELVYVTIDENAGVKIEPYKINHGDGWDDESDAGGYSLDGDFDISGVNAAGDYGSISLYTFIESLGTQYGVGTFTVNNTDSAKVYLVRP